MSVHQWFVIALNIAAFIGMVTMFVVYGHREAVEANERDEKAWNVPPVDYRQHRKI